MTFDKITDDGRLWAVRYDAKSDNELHKLFDQWSDVVWLRAFFRQHWSDLLAYCGFMRLNSVKVFSLLQAVP